MALFVAQAGAVWMLGGKPWRMSETAVDSFLDTFELEGETERYQALERAAKEAYGDAFIPRACHLRLVVNHTPSAALHSALSASVELEAAIVAKSMEQTL